MACLEDPVPPNYKLKHLCLALGERACPCPPVNQFSLVAQLCLTLYNPMDCSMPGFPVHHQVRELAQTLVHQLIDAIQPSHPLSSPSSPTFNLFQHQGLLQ